MIERQTEPPFFKRRWVQCVQCLRTFGVRPPYKGKRSSCCGRPLRSKLWGGWSLRELANRLGVAEAEDQRTRMSQDRRTQGGGLSGQGGDADPANRCR